MKSIYTLINATLLLLTAGGAFALENDLFYPEQTIEKNKPLNDADRAFIRYIDDYIYNPSIPFPADFKDDMVLSSIKRYNANIFIQLTSNDYFEEVYNPLEDPLLSADLISDGYFYRLGFLYDKENNGICNDTQFRETQSVIRINYDFPNIGYKTQVTKPINEICGWVNRDQTPSQDTSFNVTAQRNLFSHYAETIARAMNTYWANNLTDKTLTLSVENNTTFLYTLRDKKRLHPITEKDAFERVFPETMCQFIQPFKLLNIRVKVHVSDYTEANPQSFEESANKLCTLHIKNIFNLK